MLYEILQHIKDHGKIDSAQVKGIVDNFADLNQESVIKSLDNSEFVRYSQYGIEAIKETVARQKKGKYDLLGSSEVKSQARPRFLTSDNVTSPTPGLDQKEERKSSLVESGHSFNV